MDLKHWRFSKIFLTSVKIPSLRVKEDTRHDFIDRTTRDILPRNPWDQDWSRMQHFHEPWWGVASDLTRYDFDPNLHPDHDEIFLYSMAFHAAWANFYEFADKLFEFQIVFQFLHHFRN